MTFVKEDLAKVHLAEITCAECHGLSDKHANDENIGATKPDIVYQRDKVDGCEKCHEKHDAPATQVLARFLERKLPLQTTAICTDCHGTHKIDRSAEALQLPAPAAAPVRRRQKNEGRETGLLWRTVGVSPPVPLCQRAITAENRWANAHRSARPAWGKPVG